MPYPPSSSPPPPSNPLFCQLHLNKSGQKWEKREMFPLSFKSDLSFIFFILASVSPASIGEFYSD